MSRILFFSLAIVLLFPAVSGQLVNGDNIEVFLKEQRSGKFCSVNTVYPVDCSAGFQKVGTYYDSYWFFDWCAFSTMLVCARDGGTIESASYPADPPACPVGTTDAGTLTDVINVFPIPVNSETYRFCFNNIPRAEWASLTRTVVIYPYPDQTYRQYFYETCPLNTVPLTKNNHYFGEMHYVGWSGNHISDFHYRTLCGILGACVDECSPSGAKQCSVSGVPQVCAVDGDADSCLEWKSLSACPVGQSCVNGNCVVACVDECSPSGARQCSGLQPQECVIGGSGCLEWVDAGSVCSGSTPVCSGGNCLPAQVLFKLKVSPVPLYEGQQLNVELEIASNTAKNYDVGLVVDKTVNNSNLFSLEKKGIVVDPSAVVGFYGPPKDPDFDTMGLVAGNYSVTVKAIDASSGNLAFEETVFIAVVPVLQVAVPELPPLIAVLVALTVLLVVFRKSRNR